MAKILVDLLPAMGHFNSSLKIVQLLRSSGHDVIYLNQGLKAELAKYDLGNCTTGFNVMPVLLKNSDITFKRLYRLVLLPGNKKEQKLESALQEFESFKKFIANMAPDLVLLDEQNMLKAIYYRIIGIRVISLQTKPDPCKAENVPPFTSRFIPSNSAYSRWYCSLLWLIKTVRNYFMLKSLQLLSEGNDEFTIASRISKMNGQNMPKMMDIERSFGIGVKGIRRLVISPAPFDFPRPARELSHYVGPLVDIGRDRDMRNPRYGVLCDNISEFKSKNKGFVVYCSLGSQNTLYRKKTRIFFQRLLNVARKNPEDMFILSAGEGFNISEIYPVPQNLYAFKYLPQSDLLGRCDIMISHGGMNSITECVSHGVPMLIYPTWPYTDLYGNSARVVYHGLGLRGKVMSDNEKAISKKLNLIKSSYSKFRNKVLLMRKKFEQMNNSKDVLNIIEGVIKQTSNKNMQYESEGI